MAFEKKVIASGRSGWMKGSVASPAVQVGDLLFISGQVALDETGDPVRGDIEAQATYAMNGVAEIVRHAGGNLDDLVDLIVFTRDARDIERVLEVLGRFVKSDFPAVTAAASVGFQRSELLVSIHAIAHLGNEKKHCFTPDTIKWWRNYAMSAGCRKGDLIFLGGQLAADADGYIVTPGDHAGQARFSANRLKETVQALGGSTDDIIDLLTLNHDVRGMDPTNNTWFSEIVKDTPLSEVAAVTSIGVTGLMKFGATSALRAVADLSPGRRMARTPASIWWKVQPISGGTRKESGRFIALAGQVASDGDGYITTPGDHAAQARYALNRIKEVLAEFGATMDNVVSVMPFHKEPRAWPITLEVAREFFKDGKGPAWTPVGATGLYREGYLHEIYAMALV